MEEQTILNIVNNGDASEVLIADYKSKNAIISLVAIPLLVLVPIALIELTNLDFFSYLWWLIPITVVYGLYLMFTNQAVFYASRTDLIYILALFGVPFSGIMIGNFIDNLIDSISISSIDMITYNKIGPYRFVVPPFPVITNHHQFNYNQSVTMESK